MITMTTIGGSGAATAAAASNTSSNNSSRSCSSNAKVKQQQQQPQRVVPPASAAKSPTKASQQLCPAPSSSEYRVLPDQAPRRSLPNCLQNSRSSPPSAAGSVGYTPSLKTGVLSSSTWPLVRRNSCCGGLATSDFHPTRNRGGFDSGTDSGFHSSSATHGGGVPPRRSGRMTSDVANALTTLLLR